MTRLVLQYPEQEAQTIVKAAFELTDGIHHYYNSGRTITGETALRLTSYGEKVVVNFSRGQTDDETIIYVTGERSISMNLTANPDRYVNRFLQSLDSLTAGGNSFDDIMRVMDRRMNGNAASRSKKPGFRHRGTKDLPTIAKYVLGVFVLLLFLEVLL